MQIPDYFEIAPLTKKKLLANLATAEIAREGAVTGKRHADQARVWSRWTQCCEEQSGIIEDDYLKHFSRGQSIKLMGAFAMAVRKGELSGPAYDTLAEGTVRGMISYVSQTFREIDKSNPTRDEDSKLGRLLSRRCRAFKDIDPNPEQQTAIPICVIAEVVKIRATETQRATGQLAV